MKKREYLLVLSVSILLFSGCGDGESANTVADLPDINGSSTERDSAFLDVQNSLINDDAVHAAGDLIHDAERKTLVRDGLIRESIDYSPLSIEYYAANPSAVLQTAGTAIEGPLELSDFGPVGELPVENRRPNIYVMFNKAMVPLAQLGSPMTESTLLTVDPPLEGVYRWYGTRTLGFRPDRPMLDLPRYTVTVSGDAAALDGEVLGESFTFDIFGERIRMVNFFAGNDADVDVGRWDVPTALAQELTLEFNQPVNPETVGTSLHVSDSRGEIQFSISRPDYPERLLSRTDRAVLLTLEREPEENSSLDISLEEGAVPFEGYPASTKPQSYRMRTIRPFRVERLNAYSGSFPGDNREFLYPVYLRFSHPLMEDQDFSGLELTVDGQPLEPEEVSVSWSSLVLRLSGMEPGRRLKVTVPDGIRDSYGRTAVRSTETVTIPRPEPLVDFPGHYDGLRHLEAEFDPAVVWTTRNVVEGRFGIRGIDRFFSRISPSVNKEVLDLSAIPKDVTWFHRIDLKPYLNDAGRGTVLMGYQLRKDPAQVDKRWEWVEGDVAVQVTDLGLTVRAAYDKVLVWVNRLSDGSAVPGADVTAFNLNGVSYGAVTDADGLAVIELPAGAYSRHFFNRPNTRDDSLHIRAEYQGDTAEMRTRNEHSAYAFGVYSTVSPEDAEQPHHRIHLFTDRGLYKGGEELAFRGIHWVQNPQGFRSYQGGYSVRILDAESEQTLWSDTGSTSASGGFSGKLVLPEDLDPGDYLIRYAGEGFSSTVGFRIASFRRVSFQVASTMDRQDYYHGESLEVSVQAQSLSGGAIPSAPYHYFWTRKPFRFVPPGPLWNDWTFGTSDWAGEQSLSSGDGTLSGSGTTRISEGTVSHEVTGKAYRYTVETTVEDLDRQVVSSRAVAVVHPASYYVGARFDQGTADGWWSRFVSVGDEVTVQGQLVDPSGNKATPEGTLTVGLIRGEWTSAGQQGLYGRVNTRWEYVEEELWRKELELKDGGVEMDFSTEKPGRHILFMEYIDQSDRVSRTEIDFYATGSGWVAQASRTPRDINLIVDRDRYEPGETARILVQSPIPAGRYLLTIEREGILEEKVIRLDGSTEVIEIPVKDNYLPVVYVALSSFTERTETEEDYFEPDLGKPRDLFGLTTLRVDTTPVELEVRAESSKLNYRPGDRAEFTVTVRRNGAPVSGAEVTILAVDRGVLDLIDYHVPDPLDYFYNENHFPLGTIGDDSRRLLLRPVTYELSDLQGGGGRKLDERSDFNPLALFEPAVTTDSQGQVTVTADLPDTLSTYRLSAVALEGVRLGMDETEFMVSNPVNVRTALPRRFRNRDSAAAGVILTNTTDAEVQLNIAVESDILTVSGVASRTVDIPGGTAMELPFLFEALRKGEGEVVFTIQGEVLNERLIEKVTVEEPVVKESFTTIGVAEPAAPSVESVVIPGFSAEGYGGLSLTADSSFYPFIKPALDNLRENRYPSTTERLYRISADLVELGKSSDAQALFDELAAHQFPDGGIGYRSPNVEYAGANWYLSVLTAHTAALLTGSDSLFRNPLDQEALDGYLKNQLEKASEKENPSFLAGWTAAVLAGRGSLGPGELSWLFESEDSLGIGGYALLSAAYDTLGLQRESRTLFDRMKNFLTVGTQSVSITETYEKSSYFSSAEAELALFLRTSVSRDETEEQIFRIAGSLDRSRNARRFTSYFDDFWLINGFMDLLERQQSGGIQSLSVDLDGERLLSAAGTPGEGLSVSEGFPFAQTPLAGLERESPLDLRFTNEGEGPIYYASTLRYALPVETALPRDEGIEVSSSIETLDGDILDENSLPLGETLRMRVSLSTLERRSYLKLTVPVPSGCEIVDASLATSGSYLDAGGTDSESWIRETAYGDEVSVSADGYAGYGPGGWWYWFYRPVQKIYDNAVSYLWEDFYEGQREVSFLIRTTTPGVFPTPPVNAVLEFEPEVFGRGPGWLAIIRGE